MTQCVQVTSLSIRFRIFVCAVLAAVIAGCATKKDPGYTVRQMLGESLVFVGEQPAFLAHTLTATQSVTLRSTYLPTPTTVTYVEGVDFIVDGAAGSIRRLPGSRIPDFTKNVLFGQDDFDHNRFPGFGNTAFFAFATYPYNATNAWPVQSTQIAWLTRSQAKLADGRPIKIVAYGDSITAGGDATSPSLIYWQRWADDLQRRYPTAKVTAINGATGGDSTVQGLARLQSKVLVERPDLVLVAFGMNDHNKGSVSVPQFELNLREMIARIRTETGAEIILLSAFPPNPKWKFGTQRMGTYALATEGVARATGCAFADVYSNWQLIAARKKPEDLLGNNINHPNDYGHGIYFEVLRAVGL